MNPIDLEIISTESARLESIGIAYDHIHCSDGKPVVTVDPSTMRSIISKRNQGQPIEGLFISKIGSNWTASKLDTSGKCHHKGDLTECKAYRWVLGYPIGHYQRRCRYIGQPNYKNSRKPRSKPKSV